MVVVLACTTVLSRFFPLNSHACLTSLKIIKALDAWYKQHISADDSKKTLSPMEPRASSYTMLQNIILFCLEFSGWGPRACQYFFWHDSAHVVLTQLVLEVFFWHNSFLVHQLTDNFHFAMSSVVWTHSVDKDQKYNVSRSWHGRIW